MSFKSIAITATILFISTTTSATTIIGGPGLVGADVNINFTEVIPPNSTPLTNQYASFGVTFSGFYYNGCQTCVLTKPSGVKPDITNFANGMTSVYNSTLSMMFATEITDISFSTAYNSGSHAIAAYNNGTLIESQVLDNTTWQTYGFTGITFDELRLDLNEAFLLDNLKFNTSTVPVPAAVWLFGSGLLGLIGVARRKKL